MKLEDTYKIVPGLVLLGSDKVKSFRNNTSKLIESLDSICFQGREMVMGQITSAVERPSKFFRESLTDTINNYLSNSRKSIEKAKTGVSKRVVIPAFSDNEMVFEDKLTPLQRVSEGGKVVTGTLVPVYALFETVNSAIPYAINEVNDILDVNSMEGELLTTMGITLGVATVTPKIFKYSHNIGRVVPQILQGGVIVSYTLLVGGPIEIGGKIANASIRRYDGANP